MASDKKRMDCLESLRGDELEAFFWETMIYDIAFRKALDLKIKEKEVKE